MKIKNKLLCTVLSLCLLFTPAAVSAKDAMSFGDLTSWFHRVLMWPMEEEQTCGLLKLVKGAVPLEDIPACREVTAPMFDTEVIISAVSCSGRGHTQGLIMQYPGNRAYEWESYLRSTYKEVHSGIFELSRGIMAKILIDDTSTLLVVNSAACGNLYDNFGDSSRNPLPWPARV